jgi:small-conductance mechanosensitive channel
MPAPFVVAPGDAPRDRPDRRRARQGGPSLVHQRGGGAKRRHAAVAVWLWTALVLATAAPPVGAQPAAPTDSTRHATAASSAAITADSVATPPVRIDTSSVNQVARRLTVESQTATAETVATKPPEAVPVFLDSRKIYTVRVGRDGLSASDRAKAIRTRITEAVRDNKVPADSVRLIRTPEGIEVRFGRHFLWLIAPADLGDRSVDQLSDWIAELPATIRDGIQAERESRRPLRIVVSAGIGIVLTLGAWVLFRLLLAASKRWSSLLNRLLPRYVRGIRLRNFEVLSKNQIVSAVGSVLARLDVVVGALLLYGYLTLLFSLFPWTQGWSWALLQFAVTLVTDGARSVASAIPGLLVIAVIAFIFSWITKLVGRFFDEIESGSLQLPGFHVELARPSKRLLRILLWIIAAMIAYPYIPGGQSKAVQGMSILLGVMVSLGSTGFVGNIISGIVLTYSRSFRVGDRVRIGEVTGDVVSLGFFATKLKTIRNEEVTLPNGQVASQPIMNYTRLSEDPGLVLHTQVTIGYDVDWRRVHALLIEASGKVEGIEKDPAPLVYQRALNDYNVTYELTAVTHLSHPQLRLYSDLHQEIQDAFAAAGIEILSPAFYALRDANAVVLPAEPKGPRPGPGAFRIDTKGSGS